MQLERDHAYLIPPGAYLAIREGTLRLSKPRERHGARMPFDFFLRSLAEECGERAICAILSGTGTDGSLGLKAVKEKGGLVIVQDPEEAAFDGMPRSAIMSGGADLVLAVAKIPQALVRYSRQKYVKDGSKGLRAPDNVQEAFADIIDLLAAKTPHDFSLYKQGTLQRRIERRMAMAGIESSARYLHHPAWGCRRARAARQGSPHQCHAFLPRSGRLRSVGGDSHSGPRARADAGSTIAHLGARLQHG